jgi:hypothetical protein
MALAANALLDLAELKDYLGVGGDNRDAALEGIVNRVSDEISDFCDREFIAPADDYTEYHTMQSDGRPVYTNELRTMEWPIISVTSVNEDTNWPPTYPAGSLLTVGTDFLTIKPRGILRRIGAPLAGPAYIGPGAGPLWLSGLWSVSTRSIRVVYKGGYATSADVPGRVKAVALRYAALCWDEMAKGRWGTSGGSDALGNYTRFTAAKLTDDMQDVLTTERRPIWWQSGERDA